MLVNSSTNIHFLCIIYFLLSHHHYISHLFVWKILGVHMTLKNRITYIYITECIFINMMISKTRLFGNVLYCNKMIVLIDVVFWHKKMSILVTVMTQNCFKLSANFSIPASNLSEYFLQIIVNITVISHTSAKLEGWLFKNRLEV